MPQFIGYSPWQDAAQYGRSLGETLGQILLGVPQMRHQKRLQERQDQRAEASLGSQLALNEARVSDLPFQRKRQEAYNTLQEQNARNNALRLLIDMEKANADVNLLEAGNLFQYDQDEWGYPTNIRVTPYGEVNPEQMPDEGGGSVEEPGMMDRVSGFFRGGGEQAQPADSGPSLESLKVLAERILTPNANSPTNNIPSRVQGPAERANPGLGQQIVGSSGQGRGLDVMQGRINPVTEATPPTPENNVLVRDPRTGQKGWVTEAEASQYEVIRVFPRR